MMHLRARRLLPDLVDGTLDEATRVQVEMHVQGCARCRRLRREFTTADLLLAQMPVAFGPLDFDPTAYARLVRLNRWSDAPDLHHPERWNAPILALASAGLIVVMAATMSHWSPMVPGQSPPISMGLYQPESAFIPPAWTGAR